MTEVINKRLHLFLWHIYYLYIYMNVQFYDNIRRSYYFHYLFKSCQNKLIETFGDFFNVLWQHKDLILGTDTWLYDLQMCKQYILLKNKIWTKNGNF